MKQNKKNVAVFLAVLVLFASLSLPAFASDTTDFSSQPIPIVSSYSESSIRGAGFIFNVRTGGATYYAATTSDSDVFVFALPYSYAGGSYYQFVFASSDQVNFSTSSYRNGYGEVSQNSPVLSSFSEDYNLYYFQYTSFNNAVFVDNSGSVPYFDSLDEGLEALSSYINPSAGTTPHPLNYSIPAGYVAYFEIPSNEIIRASVTTTSGVPLTPAQWASTNVLYGYSSSLPSGAFTLPITGSTSFKWNTGKTNLFGKSQHWSWLGTINTSSKYYFISNPTYSNVIGTNSTGSSMVVDNPSSTNGYVDVYLSSVIDVKLFPLKSTIVYDPSIGAYGGIDDGASGESYGVGYDDSTGQWVTTDPSGNPVGVGGVPIGGDNSIDSIPTSDTIVDWLENIARTIGAFFRGAVGAVTTLVGAGSDFIHALVGLYSWLPGSVYAVLSSALILVIVIGVIKVFV